MIHPNIMRCFKAACAVTHGLFWERPLGEGRRALETGELNLEK